MDPKEAKAHDLIVCHCTDITGEQNSKKGIIDVYDIFGIMPQTLQGADRLAESLNAVVLVPDFFRGNQLDPKIFPPDTAEKKRIAQTFMADQANIERNTQVLLETTAVAKEKFSSVQSWGAFGLCWGGKLVVLASGPESPFKVSGTAHPGRLAKEDAEKLAVSCHVPSTHTSALGEHVCSLSEYVSCHIFNEILWEAQRNLSDNDYTLHLPLPDCSLL